MILQKQNFSFILTVGCVNIQLSIICSQNWMDFTMKYYRRPLLHGRRVINQQNFQERLVSQRIYIKAVYLLFICMNLARNIFSELDIF